MPRLIQCDLYYSKLQPITIKCIRYVVVIRMAKLGSALNAIREMKTSLLSLAAHSLILPQHILLFSSTLKILIVIIMLQILTVIAENKM